MQLQGTDSRILASGSVALSPAEKDPLDLDSLPEVAAGRENTGFTATAEA